MKKKITLTGDIGEGKQAEISIDLVINFDSSISIRNIIAFLTDNVNYNFSYDQSYGKSLSVSCTSIEALDDLVKVIKEIR